MNCVLFAKMNQVLSKENRTLKKYWKIKKKYWKIQGKVMEFCRSGKVGTLVFSNVMYVLYFGSIKFSPFFVTCSFAKQKKY